MQGDDEWLLTAARCAIHKPTATAVVSDLHFGYGEARRRGGEAVPTLAVAALLAPLGRAFERHGVRGLVIAGDLFEGGVSIDLVHDLLLWLKAQSVELIAVVPGNHDRSIDRAADLLPLQPNGCFVGERRIVHGDGQLPDGPFVQGHEHPWFRWSAKLSAPCYLAGPRRLILPAYSADAAGVNVLRRREWGRLRCAVIVGDDVLDFGPVAGLRGRA